MNIQIAQCSKLGREEILIYFGPLIDGSPLIRHYKFSPHVKYFVYIDGMPDSQYVKHEKYNSIDTLLNRLEKQILKWSYLTIKSRHTIIDEKYIHYMFSDNRELHYFFNTTDNDVMNCSIPKQLSNFLNHATVIYLKGFMPVTTIYSQMPNLKLLTCSDLSTDAIQYYKGDCEIFYDFDYDDDTDEWIGIKEAHYFNTEFH